MHACAAAGRGAAPPLQLPSHASPPVLPLLPPPPPRPWPYDQGSLLNFQSVFGRDRRYWALPLHTPAFRRGLLEDALQTPPPPDELLGSRELV